VKGKAFCFACFTERKRKRKKAQEQENVLKETIHISIYTFLFEENGIL